MTTYANIVKEAQEALDARAGLKPYRVNIRVSGKPRTIVLWLTEAERKDFPLGRIFVESVGPDD